MSNSQALYIRQRNHPRDTVITINQVAENRTTGIRSFLLTLSRRGRHEMFFKSVSIRVDFEDLLAIVDFVESFDFSPATESNPDPLPQWSAQWSVGIQGAPQ